MQQWRLFPLEKFDAATNMAIDEMFIGEVAAKRSLPVLRFYQWQKPTISLGYFQRHKELDLEAIRLADYEWVRRLTGGRAVLHHQELTYSMVLPESTDWLPRQVNEAYRVLSMGLVYGLQALGIQAEMVKISSVKKPTDLNSSAACFDAPSWYELAVDGRKLVGSAQTRQKGVVLQHGSILLESHAPDLVDVLALSPAGKEELLHELEQKAAALGPLSRANGIAQIELAQLQDAIVAGKQRALPIELVPSKFDAHEKALTADLVNRKYRTNEWNLRR